MPITIYALLVSIFACGWCLELTNNDKRRVPFVNVSGDLILGGLFPVHRKGTAGSSCGEIQKEDGIQPLEAMLYTVERVNNDPTILPGVRLGVLAFDTCDNPVYAMEQALHFVKGFIARQNREQPEYQCKDGSAPEFWNGEMNQVVAVLGAQSSSVTTQVASVLALFPVPQISYMATSPLLSSKERFPQFFRTVPSDINQARAMLEILRRFGWTYVSVVYTDSEYGDHGYETLTSLAGEYSVCFSAPHRVSQDRFTNDDYDQVVRTIAEKTDVRVLDSRDGEYSYEFRKKPLTFYGFNAVVVLFAEKSSTLSVLKAARRLGVGSRFVWLVSDSWPARHERTSAPTAVDRETTVLELEGALAVQPLYARLSGFDEYFTGLKPDHQRVNPWFREFWNSYHRCDDVRRRVSCTDSRLRISRINGYKQRRFLHFVRDAVYAVAYALRDMRSFLCGNDSIGLCDAMRPLDASTFSMYLGKVSFKDEAGNGFRFVNEVDGLPRYSILNYQRMANGSYHWAIVGNYTQNEEGQPVLQLDRKNLRFRGERMGEFPSSSCSQPCGPNRIMVRNKEDPCCWRCQSCGLYRYKLDEQRCEECDWGTVPAENGTGCSPIPEQFVDYSNPWAIVAIAVAVSGMALTAFVCWVFYEYRHTPMIKASGRELSFLLLFGTFGCFAMTFAVVAKPSDEGCALVRFGIGFCYTVCYAALATKINRIHRIFNDPGRSPRKRRYTSPKSQLAIASILVMLEIAFDALWLFRDPPTVKHWYPTRDANVRVCRDSEGGSYVVGLVYPFFLTVASTFYAIKTRKCPEGFNETRCIAFANYATIVLWLAFVPLYLASTSNAVRVITLALSLSLNGLVQLVCLFLPKIYVVLIKPEKNTRELVMARPAGSSYPTAPATPTPPEPNSTSPSFFVRNSNG